MPNIWKSFQSLIPGNPLLVGDITDINADGSKTVDLLDGGSVRARGAGSIGERVFVRAGKIEGVAPTLPLVSIDL